MLNSSVHMLCIAMCVCLCVNTMAIAIATAKYKGLSGKDITPNIINHYEAGSSFGTKDTRRYRVLSHKYSPRQKTTAIETSIYIHIILLIIVIPACTKYGTLIKKSTEELRLSEPLIVLSRYVKKVQIIEWSCMQSEQLSFAQLHCLLTQRKQPISDHHQLSTVLYGFKIPAIL